MKTIGLVCQEIRLENDLTLKEFGEKVNRNVKTLSAFEHGRSTNMNILLDYLDLVSEKDRAEILDEIIRSVENGN